MAAIVMIDVKTKPGKRAEFLTALRRSLKDTLKAPGCTRLDYLVDDSNPNRVVVIEGWTTKRAHQAYSKKLMAAGGMAELMPFMDGMPSTIYLKDNP